MSNLAISVAVSSSPWLVSVDFDGGEATVVWCDADDVEHTTTVEIYTERHGYGRGVRFSCEVAGDLPSDLAHRIAERAEDRAENDYWGV